MAMTEAEIALRLRAMRERMAKIAAPPPPAMPTEPATSAGAPTATSAESVDSPDDESAGPPDEDSAKLATGAAGAGRHGDRSPEPRPQRSELVRGTSVRSDPSRATVPLVEVACPVLSALPGTNLPPGTARIHAGAMREGSPSDAGSASEQVATLPAPSADALAQSSQRPTIDTADTVETVDMVNSAIDDPAKGEPGDPTNTDSMKADPLKAVPVNGSGTAEKPARLAARPLIASPRVQYSRDEIVAILSGRPPNGDEQHAV
ncbi:MAG: hypothetical protein JWN95_4105 [Frankiales bacterium]|nr:hypothetical protein [Frankiales bacterium]